MASIEYNMDTEAPCIKCHTMVPLDDKKCPNCKSVMTLRFSLGDLITTLFNDELIDARSGGFVIGGHDEIDDIPMVSEVGSGIFQLIAFMQGGEFIVNDYAYEKHSERIEKINSFNKGEYHPLKHIPLSDSSRVFNVNGFPDQKKVLLVGPRSFIVNRLATQKYFQEIEKLNQITISSVLKTTRPL